MQFRDVCIRAIKVYPCARSKPYGNVWNCIATLSTERDAGWIKCLYEYHINFVAPSMINTILCWSDGNRMHVSGQQTFFFCQRPAPCNRHGPFFGQRGRIIQGYFCVARHCYTWWVLWCACIFPVNTGQFIRIVHLCNIYLPFLPRGERLPPSSMHCRQAAPNKPSSPDVEHDPLTTNYDIPFSYRVTSSQDDLWLLYSHFHYYRQWLLTASTFRLSQLLSAPQQIVICRSRKKCLTDSAFDDISIYKRLYMVALIFFTAFIRRVIEIIHSILSNRFD